MVIGGRINRLRQIDNNRAI
ncbi:hypothetical protein YPPY89_2233, partial [Yersinia pestis PY-89]